MINAVYQSWQASVVAATNVGVMDFIRPAIIRGILIITWSLSAGDGEMNLAVKINNVGVQWTAINEPPRNVIIAGASHAFAATATDYAVTQIYIPLVEGIRVVQGDQISQEVAFNGTAPTSQQTRVILYCEEA